MYLIAEATALTFVEWLVGLGVYITRWLSLPILSQVQTASAAQVYEYDG